MKPESIEYAGWNNCLRLSNGVVELIATLDVGPRILRFGFVDGQNLFHEFDHQLGQTGAEEWTNYGGHRLWHAPEVEPRTYFPDNAPVAHTWDGNTLTLTPPPEHTNALQLSLQVTLDPSEPKARINHLITNIGVWDVELAPWSLSVMEDNGRAILPQEPYVAHGQSLTPARPLVLWKYTNMADPRFTWGEKFIQLQADPSQESRQKFGALNTLGWMAYLLKGEVFVKRYGYEPGATYTDMNCNSELFTMPGFLEVETLAPLQRIAPGATAEHLESWTLFRADIGPSDDDLERDLIPLVNQTSL